MFILFWVASSSNQQMEDAFPCLVENKKYTDNMLPLTH